MINARRLFTQGDPNAFTHYLENGIRTPVMLFDADGIPSLFACLDQRIEQQNCTLKGGITDRHIKRPRTGTNPWVIFVFCLL